MLERRDGDVAARSAPVDAVRLRRYAGSRCQLERHDIACGHHLQGAIIARYRRLLQSVIAYTQDGEQATEQRQDDQHAAGQVDAHLLETGPDPGLGRAERQVQIGGDLRVRQFLEEGKAQRLALGRRERLDGLPHGGAAICTPCLLVRPGIIIWQGGEVQAIGIRRDLRAVPPSAQFVDDAQMGDAQHPMTECALRGIEGGGLAPDHEEDVLDDLLGGVVAQRLVPPW